MKPFKSTFMGKSYLQDKIGEIHFGIGASLEAGKDFKELGCTKVMAFYDQGIAKLGMADPIVNAIKAEGIDVIIFDECQPDPPDTIVEKAANIARENKVDGIIAIGGGSSMDPAKVVVAYMEAEGPVDDYMTAGGRKKWPTAPKAKFISVPTTSGTGAEMTQFGVISSSKRGIKDSMLGGFADVVILDPTLTAGCPPYITYTTGVDALSHAIERLTAVATNPRAEMICGQCCEWAWEAIPALMADMKDMEARCKMMIAANFVMDFTVAYMSARSNLCHAIGHTIGAHFHIAHGHTLALVLPAYVRYIGKTGTVDNGIKLIAKRMNLQVPEGATIAQISDMIADAIDGLNKKFNEMYGGKLQSFAERGISKEDFLAIADDVYTQKVMIDNTTKVPTKEEMVAILAEIYGE